MSKKILSILLTGTIMLTSILSSVVQASENKVAGAPSNPIENETKLSLDTDENTISVVDPDTNKIRKYVVTRTLSGTTVTEYLDDELISSVDADKTTGKLLIKENNKITEDNVNNYIKCVKEKEKDNKALDAESITANLASTSGEVYIHSEYDSNRNIGALLLGTTTTTNGTTNVIVFSTGTKVTIVIASIVTAVSYLFTPAKFATVLLTALGVNIGWSTLTAAIDSTYKSQVDYTALRCSVNGPQGSEDYYTYREYTYALFTNNKTGVQGYEVAYSRGNLNTNSFICWDYIRYFATYHT